MQKEAEEEEERMMQQEIKAKAEEAARIEKEK